MMEELLPRHLEIIYHINHLHMEAVKVRDTTDYLSSVDVHFHIGRHQ